MKTGFTYKNIHSSRFGSVATKSRPALPEVRTLYVTLPGADGEKDYKTLNEYGRAMYKKRIFTVVMKISAENITALQQKISAATLWLMGDGELIFDDMPTVKWLASVVSEIGYAPEKQGRSALLTVNFSVEPFSVGLHTSELTLDSVIYLSRDIELDFDKSFTWECSTGMTVTVNNIGTAPVRPVITISPKDSSAEQVYGTWAVSVNGKKLEMTDSAAAQVITYVLDMHNYTLTRGGSGTNYLGTLQGEFFELAPGANEVSFEFSAELDRVITLYYEPRYFYDAVNGVM